MGRMVGESFLIIYAYWVVEGGVMLKSGDFIGSVVQMNGQRMLICFW